MDSNTFYAQLGLFESTLIPFYRQKTALIAGREAARFQYLTGMKASYENIVSKIFGQVMMDQNAEAITAVDSYLYSLKQRIPMTNMLGVWDNTGQHAYMPDPTSMGTNGGVPTSGFLSPIENLLVKSFSSPEIPDQRPAYKIYGEVGYRNVYNQTLAQWKTFELPDLENFKNTAHEPFIPYVQEIITRNYGGTSLSIVVLQMKDLFVSLSNKSLLIIALQQQIDAAEDSLATFVSDNAQYGNGVDTAAILTNLRARAEAADVPPPVQTQTEAELLPVTAAPVDNSTRTGLNPWFLAVASIGALVMMRKK